MGCLPGRCQIGICLLSATLAAATHAEPVGTAFTYQGQLKLNDETVNGNVDLRMSLYGVDAGGSPQMSLDISNVSVNQGLFTVELDFGAAVFDGDAHWLEVAVRSPHDPTDSVPFLGLTPRQRLSATPYSLQTRGIVVSDQGNVGIGTQTPTYPVHVYADGSDVCVYAKTDTASGASIVGDATSGSGTTYGIYGRAFSPDGRSVYGVASSTTGQSYGGHFESSSVSGIGVYGWASAGSGTNYGIYGETDSSSGYAGYFLGGRNYFDGNVGIGTKDPDPSYKLHVKKFGGRAIYAENSDRGGTALYGHGTGTLGPNYAVYGKTDSPDGYAGYFEGGRNYFKGNVGIGHTNPSYALTVSGNNSRAISVTNFDRYCLYAENNDETGIAVYGYARSNSNVNYGVRGITNSPDGFAGYFSGGKNYFSGNVGIGTISPSSETSLHIEADDNDFGVLVDATGTPGSEIGLHAGSSGYSSLGKNAFYNGAWSRFDESKGSFLQQIEPDGDVRFRVSPSGTGSIQWKTALFFSHLGQVGVGTTSPQEKLHLAGANANLLLREGGGSPYMELGDSTVQRGYLQWQSNTNRLLLYTSGHDYPIAVGRTDLGGIFIDTDSNGSDVGIGTESPLYKLHVAGSAGKPGGGSWTNSSDRRLKKNIRDLPSSLNRLLSLKGVSFEYKNPKTINELPGERIGMIAQDVERVFPDWVSQADHGYKTVTYRGFEALTVEALRELRAEKDAQIAELQAENGIIREKLHRLEKELLKTQNHAKYSSAIVDDVSDRHSLLPFVAGTP